MHEEDVVSGGVDEKQQGGRQAGRQEGDFETGGETYRVAHSKHVQGVQLPAGHARKRLVVAVKEAQAGSVAVEHDEVLVNRFAHALDRVLVEGAVFAGQLDHLRAPHAEAKGIVALGEGRRGVGGCFFEIGDHVEQVALSQFGVSAGPLVVRTTITCQYWRRHVLEE